MTFRQAAVAGCWVPVHSMTGTAQCPAGGICWPSRLARPACRGFASKEPAWLPAGLPAGLPACRTGPVSKQPAHAFLTRSQLRNLHACAREKEDPELQVPRCDAPPCTLWLQPPCCGCGCCLAMLCHVANPGSITTSMRCIVQQQQDVGCAGGSCGASSCHGCASGQQLSSVFACSSGAGLHQHQAARAGEVEQPHALGCLSVPARFQGHLVWDPPLACGVAERGCSAM